MEARTRHEARVKFLEKYSKIFDEFSVQIQDSVCTGFKSGNGFYIYAEIKLYREIDIEDIQLFKDLPDFRIDMQERTLSFQEVINKVE